MKINGFLFFAATVASSYSAINTLAASIPRTEAMTYSRLAHPSSCSLVGCNSNHNNNWNKIERFRRRNNIFDRFDEIFSIPLRFSSLLQEEYERQLSLVGNQSHPRYYIKGDDEKMELTLEVPGLQASDISIQLENDGKLLVVRGVRYHGTDNQKTFRSQFERSFSLDGKTANVNELKATLSKGELIISVPKIQQKQLEDTKREIPIMTTKENEDEGVAISSETLNEEQESGLEITEEDI